MEDDRQRALAPIPWRRYVWLLIAGWTVAIAGLVIWTLEREDSDLLNLARAEARLTIEKDLIVRGWVSNLGGIYVPAGDDSRPNPYLSNVPERDIVTPSGRLLTLRHHELVPESWGRFGHMTSLQPLRAGDAPDDWERAALTTFARGQTEASVVQTNNGQSVLRLMRPLIVEASCLKCHGAQGYRAGDIRGGISVAVPLQPLMAAAGQDRPRIIAGFGTTWILGVGLIGIGTGSLRRQVRARARVEQELHDSAERHRIVADFTHDWEYWQAPDLSVQYTSPSCKRVTGYDVEAFTQDSGLLARLVHPEDQARWAEHLLRVAEPADRAEELDFRIIRRDGVERWMSHVCRPVSRNDGTYAGRRVSNRDITDRKRAEDALAHLATDLERRVRERTAALQEANAELEAFNYSVSHDLRTPLRHIEGFIRILEEDHAPQLSDAARHCLNRIRAGSERMDLLIDALLRLSRVGRAALQPRRVNLAAIAHAAFADLSHVAPERPAEFVVGVLPEIVGDPTLLRELFDNLIGNAIKFTRPIADPRIEVGSSYEAGRLVIFVRDNGVGFDPQVADKLFGVFQRLHNEREFPGTGIGLSIVKRIVERHGGRVWADGATGAGATFWFTIDAVRTADHDAIVPRRAFG